MRVEWISIGNYYYSYHLIQIDELSVQSVHLSREIVQLVLVVLELLIERVLLPHDQVLDLPADVLWLVDGVGGVVHFLLGLAGSAERLFGAVEGSCRQQKGDSYELSWNWTWTRKLFMIFVQSNLFFSASYLPLLFLISSLTCDVQLPDICGISFEVFSGFLEVIHSVLDGFNLVVGQFNSIGGVLLENEKKER